MKRISKFENYAVSLDWVTANENILHAHKTGLINSKNKKKPKLKYEDAKKIKYAYLYGASSKDIAKAFKLHKRHVQRIIRGDFFPIKD
jgi:DNA invertase Pin-like site-specific DNA recombinase